MRVMRECHSIVVSLEGGRKQVSEPVQIMLS